MGLIYLPHLGDLRIDPDHWLAPNLLFAHTGREAFVAGHPVDPNIGHVLCKPRMTGTTWPAAQELSGWAGDGTNYVTWPLPLAAKFPLTLGVWVNSVASTGTQRTLSVRSASALNGGVMLGVSSAELARADVCSDAGTQTGFNAGSFVSEQWRFLTLTITSSTERALYQNGGNKVTSTVSIAESARMEVVGLCVDAFSTRAPVGAETRGIAVPFVVNRVLSDNEIALLYRQLLADPLTMFTRRAVRIPYAEAAGGAPTLTDPGWLVSGNQITPRGNYAF